MRRDDDGGRFSAQREQEKFVRLFVQNEFVYVVDIGAVLENPRAENHAFAAYRVIACREIPNGERDERKVERGGDEISRRGGVVSERFYYA